MYYTADFPSQSNFPKILVSEGLILYKNVLKERERERERERESEREREREKKAWVKEIVKMKWREFTDVYKK